MANELERALETIMSPGFGASGDVTIPRALLACCLDVLTECDKRMPITGTNFDDDMALCIGNLKAILK